MTRASGCAVLLCMVVPPAAVRAQTCIGFPVYRQVAVGGQVLLAEEWVGAGARVGFAATPSFLLRLDGELLHRDGGASGAQATALAGIENRGQSTVCAFVSGSLFRRDALPTLSEQGAMSGRAGAIGLGAAHWFIGRKIDALLHAAAEGMVMRRNRTGDGAFITTLGGGLGMGRWFFGTARKSSTPNDVLLRRTDGAARVLVYASVDFGS